MQHVADQETLPTEAGREAGARGGPSASYPAGEGKFDTPQTFNYTHFWHVWSVISAKEQKSARSARDRSFALQPLVRAAANQWSERLRTTGDCWPSRSRRRLAFPPRTGRSRPRCGRRHADYEYGLRLNQLDLVTAFAGDRPGRLATVPSPEATHLSILTSSKRSPLPCRSRRGATVASARSASAAQAGCGFWTTTRWR